jgi:hypothetical protein
MIRLFTLWVQGFGYNSRGSAKTKEQHMKIVTNQPIPARCAGVWLCAAMQHLGGAA